MRQYTFPTIYNGGGAHPPHPIVVPTWMSAHWRAQRPGSAHWPGTPGVVKRLLPRGWAALDLHQVLPQCVALWAPDPYTEGLASYWLTLDFAWRSWCLGCWKPPRDESQQRYHATRHAGWAWMMTVDAVTALQDMIDSHNPAGAVAHVAGGVHAMLQEAREAGLRADAEDQQKRDRPGNQAREERRIEKARAAGVRIGKKGPMSRKERAELQAQSEMRARGGVGEEEPLW